MPALGIDTEGAGRPYDAAMTGRSEQARALLDEASAARADGDTAAARAAFVRAYDAARVERDVDAMTESALGIAAGQTFGTHPGRVPAFLHEAYTMAEGVQRTRIAIALARIWVYGADAARAVPFAAEAVAGAEAADDASLLADALDAQLLANWGPDGFDERVRISMRLEDVVAHVADVDVRMRAHIWRLTTALESLDLVAVRRQLRALDQLADESGLPRVRFFAASRQAMYALLMGETARAKEMLAVAVKAGYDAGEADAFAIQHALSKQIAQQDQDRAALEAEAEVYEQFGVGESVVSVAAEAAELWLDAGNADRARRLLDELAGNGLGAIPRDVDWLLTVSTLTLVAARLGVHDLTVEGVAQLEPYSGRGIGNAGAVTFPGVVDDVLRVACESLGRTDDAAKYLKRTVSAYQRMGAIALLSRVETHDSVRGDGVAYLRPGADSIWTVGSAGAAAQMREMKGFHYLRILLQRPGADISALDLSDAVAGHAGESVAQAAPDEVIDRQALIAYRRRLAELDEDLDEADSFSDAGRLARVKAERDALLDEIGRATGLGGRVRQNTSANERARVAVRKAVAAAIERITQHDEALGRLLRDCIDTGAVCRYDADPSRPITWVLD
jgi:hypothetical protein